MRSTSTQGSNSAKRKGASHQKAGVENLLQGAFFPEPDVTERMREDAILAQAKAILAKRIRREVLFEATSPAAIRDHLTLNMAEQEFESFRVLFLDRAQGFSDDYAIDFDHNGRPLPKHAQVRMCGNSVCPPVAKALVEASFAHEAAWMPHGIAA